jgi:7-carboxy-7-deazaguanine synthase
MRIAEIYRSLQGEGFLTGTESVFVRTAGCNLRCGYCDTPYASWEPEGDDLSVDEIVARVESYGCRHVVLTGGEPLLFAELIPLCAALRARGHHLTIETAGTLYLPLECDLLSLSPKLSNSTPGGEVAPPWRVRHEQTRDAPAVIRRLVAEHPYQVKFVVGTRDDCQEVLQYLARFPGIDRARVMLMPQGQKLDELRAIGEWLPAVCAAHGFHFCPRRQIEWFGPTRGT